MEKITVKITARAGDGPLRTTAFTDTRQGGALSVPSGHDVLFDRVDYADVDFRGAKFEAFRTRGGTFRRCDFRGVPFSRRFVPVFSLDSQTLFEDCRFDGADLRKADVGQSRFLRCAFERARIVTWFSFAAEFIDCTFAGVLRDCTFWGTPTSGFAGPLDPVRSTNEFRGNDFTRAQLRGTVFVAGIDIHAQRWPEDVWMLDRFGLRASFAERAIRDVPDANESARLLTYLNTLRDIFANQSDVVHERPSEPAQRRVWKLLAEAPL